MPPCFHPRFLAYRITPSPYSCPTCALPGRALCSSGAFCHSHLSPSLFLSFPGPMSAAHVSNRGRVYGRGPPHVRPSLCARSALTTPPKNTQTQTRRQTDRQTGRHEQQRGALAPRHRWRHAATICAATVRACTCSGLLSRERVSVTETEHWCSCQQQPACAQCGLLITPGPYLLIHCPPPHHALSAHGPLPQFSVTHY